VFGNRKNLSGERGNKLRPVDEELATFDESLARLESIVRENGRAMHGPRRKLGRKGIAVIVAMVAIAGIVAAAAYQSAKISGTVTPTGGLTLTGSFGTGYTIGSPKVTTWTIHNDAGSSISYYVEVNVTRSGGALASDLDLNFGGSNIVPVCAGSPAVCTYTSTTSPLASGATTTRDTSLTFKFGAVFTLTEQALGN